MDLFMEASLVAQQAMVVEDPDEARERRLRIADRDSSRSAQRRAHAPFSRRVESVLAGQLASALDRPTRHVGKPSIEAAGAVPEKRKGCFSAPLIASVEDSPG